VDGLAAVHGGYEFYHPEMSRAPVHFHLGELGQEGGRGFGGHVGGRGLDLVLIPGVEGIAGHLLQGDRPPRGGVAHPSRRQGQLFPGDFEHPGPHGEDLGCHIPGGLFRRLSRKVGGGRGVGPHIEGGHVGVAREHHNFFCGHGEHFGDDLPQRRIRPGAKVRRPRQ